MSENSSAAGDSRPQSGAGSQGNQTPDAPDKETMEKIRLRRLAKLGLLNRASPSPSEPSSPQPDSSTNTAPESSSGPSDAARAAASSSIFAAVAAAKNAASPATSKPATPAPAPSKPAPKTIKPSTSAVQAAVPVQKKVRPVVIESLEDFTDRILSEIFHVTLDPEQKVLKSNSHIPLCYLESVANDMKESDVPVKLNLEWLDAVIMEVCVKYPKETPILNYLLPAWNRAQLARRSLPRDAPQEKLAVLDEVKRLIISNCAFAITMPAYFDRAHEEGTEFPSKHLAYHLCVSASEHTGIDDEWLRAMVRSFDDVDGLRDGFGLAVDVMCASMRTRSLENPEYRAIVNTFLSFTRYPEILKCISERPTFLTAKTGRELEFGTTFGSLFRLSPLLEPSIQVFFPSARTQNKNIIGQAQNSLRMVLQGLQTDIFTIVNAFLRVDATVRARTLDWFALAVNLNHKRRALRMDDLVSSSAMMANVTRILDRLCEPFMETTFSKIDKIDVNYFRQNPRVNIMDETMLNADEATAKAFYETTLPGTPHFISEIFFLTLAAHHYGTESMVDKLKELRREITHFSSVLGKIEADRDKVSNPTDKAKIEVMIRRHEDLLNKLMAREFAIEGVLQDEKMQETSIRFMRFLAVWLLRVGSQTEYTPDKTITLPLPRKDNEVFSCIPEYALQVLADNFKYVYRHVPQVLSFSTGPELATLCITFLECSELIKNPYLKSSLVSILCSGCWPRSQFSDGILVDALAYSQFANKYLLHALIKFYIECENSGVSSAFYDKFNIRYEIFQVIKTVWGKNEIYSKKLTQESTSNRDFFVQFVNLLLNDTTYVLDEAIGKFPKIRQLEQELSPTNQTEMSAEDRTAKEDELQQLSRNAQSYMQLANETLAMMTMFTRALRDAFTMPEIAPRLASMLNYNLETLAGSKGGRLKVSNPEKYHFRPIELLSSFIDIYNNLGSSQAFVEAVAADGRSYKPEWFDRALMILTNKSMKDPADLQKFAATKEKFLTAKSELDQAELDLGDIPSEFEDPILGDLMKDPVLLPSHNIVDRSTIVQHLLSDAKDPFTRQPMSIDDVVPQTELKEKIAKWKEEKLAAAKEKLRAEAAKKAEDVQADVEAESMDTSED